MDYRRRAERALGHFLPAGAVVHHHTYKGDRSQLVICQDQSYHLLLHRNMAQGRARPRIRRGRAERGSGGAAYPSKLMIRLSRAMPERVNRSAKDKGQTASTYVRLALIDALQRDKPAEPLNTEPATR